MEQIAAAHYDVSYEGIVRYRMKRGHSGGAEMCPSTTGFTLPPTHISYPAASLREYVYDVEGQAFLVHVCGEGLR